MDMDIEADPRVDAPASDLALLQVHAGMGLDECGRIGGQWGITIAAAGEGQLLFLGADLPQPLADALQAAFAATAGPGDPAVAPAALAACERLLVDHADADAPLGRASGPCYLIPGDARFTSAAELTLSTAARQREAVRGGNPGNWLDDEWDDLVDGKLGPWAMATIGGRVVSICHTPRSMTNDAAECGVWTDGAFRGQGHAAAVTAAWTNILAPTGRRLFYATDWTNRSSQRVAARLDLRRIGSLWTLAKPREIAHPNRHPLSKPRP
jgi:hypothetical protein